MNNFFNNTTIIKTFIIILTLSLIPVKLFSQNLNTVNSKTKSDIILNDKGELPRFSSIAVIQILNKTTAKNTLIDLKIDQKTKIGTITLNAKKCWQAPIDQKPETKILIEVFEDKSSSDSKNENLTRIFYGWLFASSPSISGLEHPIYDIVALSCKK